MRNTSLTTLFFILSLIGLSLISACSSQPIKQYSGIYLGDYLVLKRSLNIHPGSARVFIQNGQISSKGFNRYDQHCRIEVKQLSEQMQIVPPGRYRIEGISVDEEQIATNTNLNLALNTHFGIFTDFHGVGGYMGIGIGSDPFYRSETMDLVHLYLNNPNYNNILRLTCASSLSDGNIMDAPQSYRPDLASINQILGYIGYIETHQGK